MTTPPTIAIDADVPPETVARARGPLQGAALLIGSVGLLAAMATDTLAVAGRHSGIHLLGSIEIVQACIVIVATASLVLATLVDAHARVHILIERLSPRPARALLRGADLLSALIFLWLAAGSAWLAADLWHATEITEILHLPVRWLRLLWIIGACLIAGIFVRHAIKGARA